MYVCHCHAVTDRQVRAAIDAGARTVADVGEHCGASTDCGGCEPTIERLLSECGACPFAAEQVRIAAEAPAA